jgi:hypothetical protein
VAVAATAPNKASAAVQVPIVQSGFVVVALMTRRARGKGGGRLLAMSSAALRQAPASWRKITLSSGMFALGFTLTCSARASQRGISLGCNRENAYSVGSRREAKAELVRLKTNAAKLKIVGD